MAYLQSMKITFNTYNDDRNDDTALHVFVKNRKSDTTTSIGASDYVSNLLAYQRHEEDYQAGYRDKNPYLGYAEALSKGSTLHDHSTNTFDIPLRSEPIPCEEVILPVVNIHILPNLEDRWEFDYTIEFFFDDGNSFSATSKTDGRTGIILDEHTLNYSGICQENPFNPQPPLEKYQTYGLITLTGVCLEFYTNDFDDNNKDSDTKLNVHIVNRLSDGSNQDILVANDVLTNTEFQQGNTNGVMVAQNALASASIRLQDIVLPVTYINIAPNGNDQWTFDFLVTYFFSNGMHFSSRTNGITLDQDYHKAAAVYQGEPFPILAPAGKPDTNVRDHRSFTKKIPIPLLKRKLDEFINNRQGIGDQDPPMWKIHLDNSGIFGDTLPESYYDVESIVAFPPPPVFHAPPDFKEGTRYKLSPSSLGQITKDLKVDHIELYLDNINSKSITAGVDLTLPAPLWIKVDFDCSDPNHLDVHSKNINGVGDMGFKTFSVQVFLTLTFDPTDQIIDVMSWVPEITTLKNLTLTPVGGSPLAYKVTGSFLGRPVPDNLVVFGPDNLRDILIRDVIQITLDLWDDSVLKDRFVNELYSRIYGLITNAKPFGEPTVREQLNAMVNSWLLGGVINHPSVCGSVDTSNVCKVSDAHFDGDDFVITYTGPENLLNLEFGKPANWPAGVDFTPGPLANIEHIVVLTMENRSFDNMLGYLSLPPDKGGMGRTDVDGLKGGEFNLLQDATRCESVPFEPRETVFPDEPPHDYELVNKAINGGKMDGFAQSMAELHGVATAPCIMAYNTGDHLPVYDALARDFAVGHRWFASHPGPTFPNRFYELTGRLNTNPDGFWEFDNSSPMRAVFTTSIFDILESAHVTWKYFEHHYTFLRFFQQHTFDETNIVSYDDRVNGFVSLARSGNLPSVSFIDPHFIELPPGANCDDAPADLQAGQKLVQEIVEALVTGPGWNKTMLIITYDEHGGWYDHVAPPRAPWPVKETVPESIGTYGVRVPALVISPWVRAGSVFGQDGIIPPIGNSGDMHPPVSTTGTSGTGQPHPGPVHPVPAGKAGGMQPQVLSEQAAPSEAAPTEAAHAEAAPEQAVPGAIGVLHNRAIYFDHTSILKTIARCFLHQNPPYMGERYAQAHDLSIILGNELRSGPFLPFIGYNFLYEASQMQLAVQGASTAAGAILWQDNPHKDAPAQQFSFEDAGGGFYYIRTHTGRMYLTATDSLGVQQKAKYPTGGSGAASPDRQRWKLTPNSIIANKTSYSISNAAFPGKVLQPSGGSSNANVPVVLGDPHAGHGVGQIPNPWSVTSPLLYSGPILTHP